LPSNQGLRMGFLTAMGVLISFVERAIVLGRPTMEEMPVSW